MKLTLPLPPSPNTLPAHHMAAHREKNDYRRRCWVEAIGQHKPWRDPPEKVVMFARFRLLRKRDEDNLAASLKWVLDALKQKQEGDVWWRQGVYDRCGYLLDDGPDHLALASTTQETVGHVKDAALEIEIIEARERVA